LIGLEPVCNLQATFDPFQTEVGLMKKLSHRIFSTLFFTFIFCFAPLATLASDFKREVIYQIITDRFFDGNAGNNNPAQSSGLYDSTKTNWRAYWGGDLQGIQAKMSYLAGMGVTAIWISPPVDN
jgi:Alpha amylase, catalytic domain